MRTLLTVVGLLMVASVCAENRELKRTVAEIKKRQDFWEREIKANQREVSTTGGDFF